MSKDIRKMINKVKNFNQFLNEDVDELINIRNYLYDYFNLNDVIEPATVPLKPDHVRLYHQTNLKNFENIKKERKIDLKRSNGVLFQEPTIIWGEIVKNKDDRGFYGDPKEIFTIEYELPVNEVDKGNGGINRSVYGGEIIAYHDPRLFNVKAIVDEPDYLESIVNNLDFAISFKDDSPLSIEYAYYLIANAIANKKQFVG